MICHLWVVVTNSDGQVKKDYLAGVGDSLDLVVVGGYYGKGKRTNVYGAFLLACYDAEGETYQTICKIGTGFSEEMLKSHWDTLHPLEVEKPRGDVSVGGAKPDIWFEPKVVWEVLTADLSLSPIYTAAQGVVGVKNSFGGILLMFRIIRLTSAASRSDFRGLFGSGTTRMRMMRLGLNKSPRCTRGRHSRKEVERKRREARMTGISGNNYLD